MISTFLIIDNNYFSGSKYVSNISMTSKRFLKCYLRLTVSQKINCVFNVKLKYFEKVRGKSVNTEMNYFSITMRLIHISV